MCQRPKRAFFISTQGAPHTFLGWLSGCQRPKRAFFISTLINLSKREGRIDGVNALNGLSSFLLVLTFIFGQVYVRCVNALNGLSSFLQTGERVKRMATDTVCQRPKRAFFISTKHGNQ